MTATFSGSQFNSFLVNCNCFGQLLCCKGHSQPATPIGPYSNYIANGKGWSDVKHWDRCRLCLRDVRCCSLMTGYTTPEPSSIHTYILHFTARRGSACSLCRRVSFGAKPDIEAINVPIYLSQALIKYLLHM